MQKTADKQKNALIKKFHTLINKAGIDPENKSLILEQYGVVSSKELSVKELAEVCNTLDCQANSVKNEADKWRKRLMASIFGWLAKMSRKEASTDLVKAIACRAAGVKKYNDIPVERLRSLYYAFTKKSRDLDFVSEVTAAEIETLIACN